MDIKLKNIKYSNGTKVFAVILAWLCFVIICGSVYFLIENDQIVTSNSYYSYPKYISNFSRHVVSIVDYYIWLKSPKSEEEIWALRIQEDDDIVDKKVASFHNATRVISGSLNFAYYIKNTETGEIITNVNLSEMKEKNPVEFLKKQREYVFINQSGISYDTAVMYHLDEITKKVNKTPYEVHCAVIEPLKKGDGFYDDYIYYKRVKTITAFVIVLMTISFILLLGALIYLFYFAGRNGKSSKSSLSFIDRIYVDIQTLAVFIFMAVYISCFRYAIGLFYGNAIKYILRIIILLSVAFFIVLTYLLSLTRQKRAGKILENILLLRIIKKVKDFIKISFNGKIFRVWILLLLPLYTFINIVFTFVAGFNADEYNGEEIFLFTVAILAIVNLTAVFITARGLKAISVIMEGTKQISGGNLDYKIDTDNMSLAFAAFAENICNIQGGLKNAVDEAIKGERMKTELITNVTHDLKTPLTSIIYYVDLLKGEEIGSKKAKEYLGVLEEKSARLKVLIEDNVLKYSMKGSRVYINISKSQTDGILTVKNISALPLDISAERLTERFVRGDESRTTEGSGLGLSIAKSLTNVQKGKFDIEIDGDLFKVIVEIPLLNNH